MAITFDQTIDVGELVTTSDSRQLGVGLP